MLVAIIIFLLVGGVIGWAVREITG